MQSSGWPHIYMLNRLQTGVSSVGYEDSCCERQADVWEQKCYIEPQGTGIWTVTGAITERYMGVIGVMNTWFKWKILYNKSVLRVVCA